MRIRYGVGPAERALLTRAMAELSRVHRAAGARTIRTLHTPPLEWRDGASDFDGYLGGIERRGVAPNRVLLFTAHQMATCRIGRDVATSTADPDGQVRGVRGLFVTDASAFPTASGVNPMLSIMALARRTAMRMAAEA